MTDQKNDASKTTAQAASAASGGPSPTAAASKLDPKKPQAILEGKAVEVSSTTIRPDAAKADTQKTSAPSGKSPEMGKYDALRTDAAKADAPAAGTSTGPGAGKTAAGSTSTGSPASTRRDAPSSRSGLGVGSFLSHLVAGVVGGAGAWYAISTVGPELGKQYGIEMPAPHATEIKIIQDELARLKKATATATAAGQVSASGSATSELDKKLTVAQAEIGKIADATKLLAAAQAKADTDLKALEEARARQADAEARVAKLEERLKLISEASGTDTKLPQLAAVTGRLVDLEATVTNQLSALRKTVSQELENRLALTDENSNAAKSGTNRVDRELSSVKSETAQIGGRLDTIKSESDRIAAGLASLRQEAGTLKTAVETLRADVDGRLKLMAKSDDVAAAVAPVSSKISLLEQNVQSIVKSEEDRKSNAERIVLSLELANLKRVIDRGQKYSSELADVSKIAKGKVDLAALERHKDSGLPTLADLNREFPAVANAMLDSETAPAADGSVLDRVMASAKSVVRVRKVGHDANDKSLEATIGRMEAALKDGRLGDAATESRALPSRAAAAGQGFLVKLESRAAVDTAIAALEKSLRSSLGGAGKATN